MPRSAARTVLRHPLDGTIEQPHRDACDQVRDRDRDQGELASGEDRRQRGKGGTGAAEREQQADVLERVKGGAERAKEDDDCAGRGETAPASLPGKVKNGREGKGQEDP